MLPPDRNAVEFHAFVEVLIGTIDHPRPVGSFIESGEDVATGNKEAVQLDWLPTFVRHAIEFEHAIHLLIGEVEHMGSARTRLEEVPSTPRGEGSAQFDGSGGFRASGGEWEDQRQEQAQITDK